MKSANLFITLLLMSLPLSIQAKKTAPHKENQENILFCEGQMIVTDYGNRGENRYFITEGRNSPQSFSFRIDVGHPSVRISESSYNFDMHSDAISGTDLHNQFLIGPRSVKNPHTGEFSIDRYSGKFIIDIVYPAYANKELYDWDKRFHADGTCEKVQLKF